MESHGPRIRAVRGERRPRALPAAPRRVRQQDSGHVPPRQDRRHAGRRGTLPPLRGVRVPGHGVVPARCELAGVRRHGEGCGDDGHPVLGPGGRVRGMTEPERPAPSPPDELGFESILYEKTPPRATITLNRPEVLNAFDFRMLRELARACEDASWDDDIRVVVLTGAGRAFCVGANLRSWA